MVPPKGSAAFERVVCLSGSLVMYETGIARTPIRDMRSVSVRALIVALTALSLSGCASISGSTFGFQACQITTTQEGEESGCAAPPAAAPMPLTPAAAADKQRDPTKIAMLNVEPPKAGASEAMDVKAPAAPETTGSISSEASPMNAAPGGEGPEKVAVGEFFTGSIPTLGNVFAPITDMNRSEVLNKVSTAAPELPAMVAPKGPPAAIAPSPTGAKAYDPRKALRPGAQKNLSLHDAVAIAVLSHPLMGAQASKVHSVSADVRSANAANMPSLEIFGGSGQATIGTYSNNPTPIDSAKIPGKSRTDAGFTFKQLIFDFGVARAEVERTKTLVDAERFRLMDQAEDIALRTVNAYLNLLEQQELVGLIDNTLSRQRALAGLVQMSQQGGNGTKADVDRIAAKVIETEAVRSDINTAYRIAFNEFVRLTNAQPSRVHRPKSLLSMVPKTANEALASAQTSNPSLLALQATGKAINHQIDGMTAQRMPRLDIQSDALVKHYATGAAAGKQGIVDMRAMGMLTFKVFDGGLLNAQTDRARANLNSNNFKTLDEQETIELNLQRFYLTIASSRTKRAAAGRGISTAHSANALYVEQFKAGKRTVFEVLDSNMMVFTMQRQRVTSEYEELRAIYGILRNMGRLNESIARQG